MSWKHQALLSATGSRHSRSISRCHVVAAPTLNMLLPKPSPENSTPEDGYLFYTTIFLQPRGISFFPRYCYWPLPVQKARTPSMHPPSSSQARHWTPLLPRAGSAESERGYTSDMMIWSGSGSGVDLHRRSGGEECRGEEEVKRRLICIKAICNCILQASIR